MSVRLHRHFLKPPAVLRWLGAALLATLLFAGCAPKTPQTWALTDIKGYLPDLKVQLQTAHGKTLTAADLRGQIVVLYFGYTHCPDVCPMTLGRLAAAIKDLGKDAGAVSLLFISVDPQRDTPKLVEQYAQAFSDRAIGATGKPAEIEQLAKRYRVAYQSEKPDADGNYEVMHSKAVYLFDRQGHARLMGTDTDPAKAFAHDLKQLIAETP
jgi:protein SCO1/2